jgi:hypothetical protein
LGVPSKRYEILAKCEREKSDSNKEEEN